MPKYSLDERGILTITNETDGGIFSVAVWLKKIALVLALVSVLVISVLYFSKYNHFTDAGYLRSIFDTKISTINISSSFSMMIRKINISYPFTMIANNAKGEPDFYADVFNILLGKAEELYNAIRSTIRNIIS